MPPSSSSSSTKLIKDFRYHVGHILSFSLSDEDCLRFLRAKQSMERSVQQALTCDQWRHHLLEALPRTNFRYSPNTMLLSYVDYFLAHPALNKLPCLHHGWDKEGRPVLWIKLGEMQRIYGDILKHFTPEDLTHFHIAMLELFEVRFEYARTRFKRVVEDAVVVMDMKGFDRVTLDMDAVWLLKSWIHLDQSYYPERLHRLFIINSPWYFSSLLGMFHPFIDKRTRKKIKVLQGNFFNVLSQHIGEEMIPSDLGGQSDTNYNSPFSELSGVSPMQVQSYNDEQFFSPESSRYLTPAEEESIRAIQEFERKISRHESIPDTQASIYFDKTASPEQLPALVSPPASPGESSSFRNLVIEMTYMSRVFSASIIGVKVNHQRMFVNKLMNVFSQSLQSHDEYVISVIYDGKVRWQVCRRYSEFDSFRKKIVKMLPATNEELPQLPPKVFLGKRSKKTISERKVKLEEFLSNLFSHIRGEAEFDGVKLSSRREEEHCLFLFLDAYKALQSYVEDADFTSDEEDGDDCDSLDSDGHPGESSTELSFRNRDQVLLNRESLQQGSLSSSYTRGGPLNRILHTRYRRVLAALLSVCILVLSLVGNFYHLRS